MFSRTKNAQNSAEAINAKIAALPDVKHVRVLENNTGQRDSFGVEPHSINVIVNGGDSADIADVIYQNKGAGVGLQGDTQVTLQRDNEQRVIKFDRAAMVDIQISMRCVRYEDFTQINKSEITEQLAKQVFNIGQAVSLSRLYSPINQVGGFWVKELKIARKGQQLKAENVVIQPREIARILPNDVTIEVE